MSKKRKSLAANPDKPPKPMNVHVYLLVPPILHEWLRGEAQAGGFKNVQEKIIDVLRTAKELRQEQAA